LMSQVPSVGMESPPSYELDVLLQGGPVHRSVAVELRDDSLAYADRRLSLRSIFWVSRRAGLLLLFSRRYTCALRGAGYLLDELDRAIERRITRATQRRLLHPLTREVVVCTAGVAVTGRMVDETIRGLRLAVFTQRGLHLISERRRHTIRWPVERAARATAGGGRPALHLHGPGVALELLYLFPEEIRAALRVATSDPPEWSAASRNGDPLEMFARGEVAPPLPPRLPEFSLSVETMREASSRGASALSRGPDLQGRLNDAFFREHFQELGEIALGPLMLRKSAAAGAQSLIRAIEAMDARGLREDTSAAVATATDRLVSIFTGELERTLEGRRSDSTREETLRVSGRERTELDGRMQAAVKRLTPLFDRLSQSQEVLLERLEILQSGPPEGEADEVEDAAAEWRTELRKLDRAYGTAWRDLLDEVAAVWSDRFLPRLGAAAALPRRGVPGWARPVLTAAVAIGIGLALFLLAT